MKKPIQFITISILIVLTVILVTNYYVQNPLDINCNNIEIFCKAMFPVLFSGSLFLILRIVGKGMYGEIKTKTVYFMGLCIFLFTNIVMYFAKDISPAGACNSFDLFGYVSVSVNLIIFPAFSAVLGNYFEKLRNKNEKNKPKQGAYS